jgi:hypothetical protein
VTKAVPAAALLELALLQPVITVTLDCWIGAAQQRISKRFVEAKLA